MLFRANIISAIGGSPSIRLIRSATLPNLQFGTNVFLFGETIPNAENSFGVV